VELFEQLRREYEFGVGTIRGVAQGSIGGWSGRRWSTRCRRNARSLSGSGRNWTRPFSRSPPRQCTSAPLRPLALPNRLLDQFTN